ncbi:hypothetical protein GX411_00415 [Candidatus Fermentibacteria bacterium]|nr:hypothetical protein [Candidatus Fermentibacteria bacterium]
MLTMLIAAALAAAGEVPTNLELIEEAVTEACLALPGALEAPSGDALAVRIEGDHEGNWLVEQCATAVLEASGFLVADSPRVEEGSPVTIRIRPMELAVTLTGAGRVWLIGSRRVDRLAVCELSTEVVDASGTVVSSIRSGASRSDRIDASDLARLQGASGEAWLTGGTPAQSGGGILEPVVVTGVVASLIYLFYSSRAE